MLKKTLSLITATVLSISFMACSTSTPNESGSGNNKTQKEETSDSKGKVYEIDGAVVEDSGITQTIKEVSVFDNMTDAVESYGQSNLVINDRNKDKVTVVLKFEITNNNDFMINTYPTQATFITNTGEQVDADLWASESFDGDIYEGVTKQGHVLFNLDKTSVDELTSFKMMWSTNHDNGTSDNYEDDYHMDNKLEVILK
ncbi:hypothetical protein R0131_05890 [Clostridium sp. AL.422]|uniref:hypothetical protein n=1 Tax=Clostridium TaxID=1485 RepID=UPI00293DC2EE|nr:MULTISPECIES: hypothetical protein [unclassified Clostridium]MDV4150360.1 hypothetical protein [Clostridium sp. AL.422]